MVDNDFLLGFRDGIRKHAGLFDFFKRTPKPAPAPVVTTPSSGEKQYVDANGKGLIKGNASSKIFHLPGGAYYDKTKAEAWFKTEAEAQAAGYRRSSR